MSPSGILEIRPELLLTPPFGNLFNLSSSFALLKTYFFLMQPCTLAALLHSLFTPFEALYKCFNTIQSTSELCNWFVAALVNKLVPWYALLLSSVLFILRLRLRLRLWMALEYFSNRLLCEIGAPSVPTLHRNAGRFKYISGSFS